MQINLILTACAAAVLCRTGIASAADVVLAEIAGQHVTAEELRDFSKAVEDVRRSGKSDPAPDSLMLESLIDKKLLLKEAEESGIGAEPELLSKLEVFHRQKVLTEYKRQAINRQVEVSEEELLAQQKLGGRDRALRVAGILLETEEEARATRQEILDGADFGELARQRSLYKETRDQGGVVPQYMRFDDTSKFLRKIFKLQAGEITEPMRFLYEKKWRYTIIKVLDEIPVPLYEVRDVVAEEVYGRKRGGEGGGARRFAEKGIRTPDQHGGRGNRAAGARLARCRPRGHTAASDLYLQRWGHHTGRVPSVRSRGKARPGAVQRSRGVRAIPRGRRRSPGAVHRRGDCRGNRSG